MVDAGGACRGMADLSTEKPARKRRDDFLAAARKAEDMAARAASPEVREQWLRIVDGYRHLAELTEKD